MRQRRVNVERLLGYLLPLLAVQVLQRAHVMQAVGQLNDDYADIGDHGQQHLADVLRLMVFAVGELDLVEFRDPLDDVRHLLAEALLDLFGGHIGVFDRVMQQAGGNRRRIHLQLRQHQRDLQRMPRIGIARGALLAFMLLQAEGPRMTDDLQVVARPVPMDFRDQAGELGIHLVDGRRAGSRKMACRGLLRRGRCCSFGVGNRNLVRRLRAQRPQWKRVRQSCLTLLACVRRDGVGTLPFLSGRCGIPGASRGRWSDCHEPL